MKGKSASRMIEQSQHDFTMAMKAGGNIVPQSLAGQITLHTQTPQHPVYQTIAKMGGDNQLHHNGNLSKIKNQFVQKSGHLMAPNYKDAERQVTNLSAYQSDAYHNNSKHRDMSNYSNNS